MLDTLGHHDGGRGEGGLRVVSLLPSATEIAFALGLGDQIVGVTHECDFPLEARSRPTLTRPAFDAKALTSREIDQQATGHLVDGGLYQMDVHLLRRLAPDIILTQDLCEVCAVPSTQARQAASALDPPPRLVSLDPHSLADILETIRTVGAATQRAEQARELELSLRRRIESVQAASQSVEDRPRTLCLEWLDPPWVAGHWTPELVSLAGGLDELGAAGSPSRKATWDEIESYVPEVVVAMPCGFGLERTLRELEQIAFPRAWSRLPAMLNGRVYAVDASSYLTRPGPRIVGGLEALAEALHPELFRGAAPTSSLARLRPSP